MLADGAEGQGQGMDEGGRPPGGLGTRGHRQQLLGVAHRREEALVQGMGIDGDDEVDQRLGALAVAREAGDSPPAQDADDLTSNRTGPKQLDGSRGTPCECLSRFVGAQRRGDLLRGPACGVARFRGSCAGSSTQAPVLLGLGRAEERAVSFTP